jgi:amidohydrolase
MTMMDFKADADALRDEMITTRRDLHRHPELGFQEVRTAGIVARRLAELGLEVQPGIARTGVVGLLEGSQAGPTLMLRFDMDALPIQERNETDYASQTPGVMHACGHDGHVTIGLAVAQMLARQRERLAGTIKFVFQPGEEGCGGAAAMIQEGVLENPRPDLALGLHLWNNAPVGRVAVNPGATMSAAEIWHCTLHGRGGHGAQPHETADPIVAAAQIVATLQTVVARNVDPAEVAVVTVGTLHAGDAFNIIPAEARLSGTIRTYKPAVRERVLDRFRAVVEGIAAAFETRAELQLRSLTPALINDDAACALVHGAAAGIAGPELVESGHRWMASEDMAYFLQEVPGCFFFVGSANGERGLNYPHHNPRFDFDEAALPLGAAILAEAATRYLTER